MTKYLIIAATLIPLFLYPIIAPQAREIIDEKMIVKKDEKVISSKEGKQLRFTVSHSPAGDSWRLVHHGGKVLNLIHSDGITSTRYEMELFKNKTDAVNRAKEIDKNVNIEELLGYEPWGD